MSAPSDRRSGENGRVRNRPHQRRNAAVMIAMAGLSLMACGNGDAAEVRTDDRVLPAAGLETALDRGPLERLPGSSFTADRFAIWYTDFDQFARYSIADGEWATYPLPDRVSPLVFTADGSGGITAFYADCNGDCWDATEPPTHGAWRIDIDGDATDVSFGRQPAIPAESAGLIGIVPRTGNGLPAEFVVRAGPASQHVAIGDEGATITPLAGSNLSMCPIDGGYLAIHTTYVEPADTTYSWTGDETWEELRADIDAGVESHLTAGPDPASLAPVEVPDEVDALLNSGAFVDACLPAGIAIVGADIAHELDVESGIWTPVESAVGDDPTNPVILGRQQVTGIAYGPGDNEVWLAGTALTVHRDNTGWNRAKVNSGFAVTHGELFSFPDDAR